MSCIAVPGSSPMYVSARSAASRLSGVREAGGIRDAAGDRDDHLRIRPPGHLRGELGDVDRELAVVGGVGIGRERAPVVERLLPRRAGRRSRPALEVRERRLVGRDHPGPRPGLDRHVADRHPVLHREARESPRPCTRARGRRRRRRRAGRSRRGSCPSRSRSPAARPRSARASSGAAPAAGTASRARARPPRCRRRTRARRRRRASRCGCRRRRSSSPAGSAPSSGPITCTIPSRPLPVAKSGTPNSSQFRRERVELRLRERVRHGPFLGRDVVVHRRERQIRPPRRACRRAAGRRRPGPT